MGSPSAESWWMLSLVGRCGAAGESSVDRLLSLLLLLSMAWFTASLLCWFFPGGPAWGRYLLCSTGGRRHGAVIPGPRGLPFIGSISLMSGLAHRRLAAAADRLGARRLMAFSIGETRAVVTCDPQVAREILNGAAFADRPVKESAAGLLFHRAIGFAPYGVYWRTLRRIAATHLFCPKQIAAASAKRGRIASEMVAALGTLAEGGGGVRVRDVLKQAALNNMILSVFGRNYGIAVSEEGDGSNEEAEELRCLVAEGYYLLGKLNFADHLPFFAALDMQGIRRRCAKLVPRVDRFVRRIIQEHRDRAAAAAVPASADFVDVLLSLQNGGDGLSDSDMVAVLWEMIFRGTDAVAVAMEWVLARLVLHPDEQKKVHRELDRAEVGETAPPPLPYLNAVVKEVLRMHPPGPLLSWARLAVADAVVGGWVVPAGTTSMVNMWAITHDPGVWPEPDRFRPDRFLEDGDGGGGGDLSSLYGADLRLAPFGSGRRSCPGKALAMATVGCWVAALLREFEWLPPSTAEAGGGVDLSEVLGLSCEMAVPLTVRLRRRRE